MPNRLGLMLRAGKLRVGMDMTIKSIQSGDAKLVLLASDASENTKKKVHDKCGYYNIEFTEAFDTVTISKAIGRRNIKALAIIDEGFAAYYKIK